MSLDDARKLLGKFPKSGDELRREPLHMIHVTRDKMLRLIHGKKNRTLFAFYVSNDVMHVGEFTLTPGKCSDSEIHKGDEALYILEGTLTVSLPDRGEAFTVGKEEGFLCPEGIRHQYVNVTDKMVKVLFAVSPGL